MYLIIHFSVFYRKPISTTRSVHNFWLGRAVCRARKARSKQITSKNKQINKKQFLVCQARVPVRMNNFQHFGRTKIGAIAMPGLNFRAAKMRELLQCMLSDFTLHYALKCLMRSVLSNDFFSQNLTVELVLAI